MNGSDVWGSSVPYGDVLPRVQMEYLQKERVFSIQNCHN